MQNKADKNASVVSPGPRVETSQSSSRSFTHSRASVTLDLIRGVAAVIVLAGHWRAIFFVDYGSLSRIERTILAPFYLITAAGHQAVIVFFVLSGYFISGAIFRSLNNHTWKWRTYLTHRVVRLWIVIIPGLLLCALWDHVGIALNRAPLLYGGADFNHITPSVVDALSWKIFLGNLFFLQTIVTRTFGSDGALWSLTNEFWYYILFPLGLIAVRKDTRPMARLVCACILLVILVWLHGALIPGFGIWLMGVSLQFLKPRPFGTPARVGSLVVLLVTLSAFARLIAIPANLADYILGIVTAICVWIQLSDRRSSNESSMYTRSARELSRFSFSLYVLHTPMLILLASLVLGDNRFTPTVPHIFAALSLLMVTGIYAWIVAWLTEFRTDKVRKFAERLIGVGKPQAASPHQRVLNS